MAFNRDGWNPIGGQSKKVLLHNCLPTLQLMLLVMLTQRDILTMSLQRLA